MKNNAVVAFLVLLGFSLNPGACMSAEPAVKTIALANAGAVTPAVLESIRSFAEKELRVPVRTLDVPKATGTNLTDQARLMAKNRGTNDVCLIVLVNLEKETGMHPVVDRTNEVAVINIKAMSDNDEKKQTARLERQVMRSAAFLLGVPHCPDPFCVLRDYPSVVELDKMGMNMCPPSLQAFEQAANKKGLGSIAPKTPAAMKKP